MSVVTVFGQDPRVVYDKPLVLDVRLTKEQCRQCFFHMFRTAKFIMPTKQHGIKIILPSEERLQGF